MAFPRVDVQDVTFAEPALYGILSPAATVVEDGDTHWESGFNYETLDCGTSTQVSSTCSPVEPVEIISGEDDTLFRSYQPFIVESSFTSSTFNAFEYEDMAVRRLLACQQKTLEREFWAGPLARAELANDADFPNRFLASEAAVDLTPTAGTAVRPKYAQAILEDALGTCGCGVRGVLHMTRGTASSLGMSGADGVLATGLGNYVIAGSGYDGSGPDGSLPAGDQHWIYATGPLTVRLGQISTRTADRRQSIDVTKNTVKVYADRAAAVTWDTCCHFAVLVDLSLDYS
jgi:hypothetical protein